MQKQNERLIQGTSGSWNLSFGAVRIHNAHLQGGRGVGANCPVCNEGLGGALAPTPAREKPDTVDEVDKGDGTDKEGDTTPPPDPWADWR